MSLVLSDLIDLAVCRFKHSGDLGDLGRLQEAGKLVGSHRQIGAWSFEDVVAVNAEEIFIEVAMERPSLRVELIVASSLGHCKSALIFMALRAIGVPVFMSGTFLISFAIPRRAIDADVEDRATPERRERDLLGEGFGEGLRRALRLGAWSFFRDGLEGHPGALA